MGLLQELETILKDLPPAKLAELSKVTLSATPRLWVPNPGPQTMAYECLADELFYGGTAGGGKLQAIDNKVLSPFGWVEIGKLKVGSKVCATDGTVTEIIGVYPQGRKQLYRVTMSDGGSTEAGLDHNWLAWRTDCNRKQANIITCGAESARKWTTGQMIEYLAKAPRPDGRARGFAIPVTDPVAFNVQGGCVGTGNFIGRPIDPYFLGLLIGDGSFVHQKRINITSMDDEIARYLRELAQEDLRIAPRAGNLASSFIFRGAFRENLARDLEGLGLLGHRAGSKAIPRQYLFAPVEARWALLQGLMDTDGWVEPKRACYYTTISKQLADDVTHLARSLGAVVSISEKIPTYTYQGERLSGQKAYCLRIRIADPGRCFRLQRKREIASGINHQSEGRFIKSIEPSRVEEAVCIQVAHRNSLYITDDFIVTHNTDLLIGTALNNHRRSLILRRLNPEVDGLIDRAVEMVGHERGLKRNAPARWRFPEKIIMFGGCQYLEDRTKYQGVPKDLIGFDEVSNFLREQYEFIIAWARTTYPGQRVRVIATGNPPTVAEGMWVIDRWAPWLDQGHPNPALPGELRWFTTINGKDAEVEGPGPVFVDGKPLLDHKGQPVYPRSRTFIPADLSDNPDLEETGYGASLNALPGALRRAMAEGDFTVTQTDDEWQVFQTAWIDAAMARWHESGRKAPMTALAVDIAQGGPDNTVISTRHGGWFGELEVFPGTETQDGPTVAGLIFMRMKDRCEVILDMGGGYGGSTRDHLKQTMSPTLFLGSESADGIRDRTGVLRFLNMRAAAHWAFRDALDPDYGSNIALPPDPYLKQELMAIRWRMATGGKVAIEPKEETKARIGRSPDRCDAVVMAWHARGATNHQRGVIGSQSTRSITSGRNPNRRR